MDHVSRPAPPKVPDIVVNGVRYSQVLNPQKLGLTGNSGWLMASDAKSGEQRWTLRVYEVVIDPADETDVQEVFFRSMKRVKGQQALKIINESGRTYIVDLTSRKVIKQP